MVPGKTVLLAAAALWSLGVLAGGAARAAETGSARAAEHVVKSGDNLHLIAAYYYRNPRRWKAIFDANRRVIRDPDLLVPGEVLKIDPAAPGWEIPYTDFVARVNR